MIWRRLVSPPPWLLWRGEAILLTWSCLNLCHHRNHQPHQPLPPPRQLHDSHLAHIGKVKPQGRKQGIKLQRTRLPWWEDLILQVKNLHLLLLPTGSYLGGHPASTWMGGSQHHTRMSPPPFPSTPSSYLATRTMWRLLHPTNLPIHGRMMLFQGLLGLPEAPFQPNKTQAHKN